MARTLTSENFHQQMAVLEADIAEMSRSMIVSPCSQGGHTTVTHPSAPQQLLGGGGGAGDTWQHDSIECSRSVTSLSLGASSALVGKDDSWSDLPLTLKSGSVKGRLERALKNNRTLRARNTCLNDEVRERDARNAQLSALLSAALTKVERLKGALRDADKLKNSLQDSQAVRDQQAR